MRIARYSATGSRIPLIPDSSCGRGGDRTAPVGIRRPLSAAALVAGLRGGGGGGRHGEGGCEASDGSHWRTIGDTVSGRIETTVDPSTEKCPERLDAVPAE